MARYPFCGDLASLVVTRDGTTNVLSVVGGETITAWNAHTGGTQYTNLASDAGGTTVFDHVVVDDGTGTWGKGVIPQFWGPDTVPTLWLQAGSSPRVLVGTASPQAAVDSAVATLTPLINAAGGGGGGGGTPPATTYNIKGYGAVGNGLVADEGPAIRSAIAAASAGGGGVVFVPAGTYNLASQVLIPGGVTIQGAGTGASTIVQKYWPNPAGVGWLSNGDSMIEAQGSLGTARTCAAVAGGGVAVITGISSTTGLAAGNYLLLASQDYYWSGYPTRYKGEIVRIKSVDSSTQVTIYGVTRDKYTTSPTVSPITMVANVGISDLSIVNGEPGTTHATGMLRFSYCRNVRVVNVEMVGSDFAGVRLTSCNNVLVSQCILRDFTDVSANSQLGYGVLAELATDQVVMDGCYIARVRHAFTTGGLGGFAGGPHNIVVSNNVATECSETAFDTHQIGGGITFVGNSAMGCSNAGYTSRSTDTRFLSNSASYCKTGIVVWGESGGTGHGTEIRGNVFRHIWGDFGARVYDADRVVIADNTIDLTSSAGIFVNSAATRLYIIGNRISNTGIDGGSARGGIEIAAGLTCTGWRIESNFFSNGTATTGEQDSGPGLMTYAIRNQSTGLTGSYFAFNSAVGLVTGMIFDAATGNVALRNYELDKPIPTDDVSAHTAATTSVHGIANTANLQTIVGTTNAIAAHAAHDSGQDPHGDRAFASGLLSGGGGGGGAAVFYNVKDHGAIGGGSSTSGGDTAAINNGDRRRIRGRWRDRLLPARPVHDQSAATTSPPTCTCSARKARAGTGRTTRAPCRPRRPRCS